MKRSEYDFKRTARTVPSYLNSNYNLLVAEMLDDLRSQFAGFSSRIDEVIKLQKDLLLIKISLTPQEYFTIDDLERLFGFSKRLQQDERSSGKLIFIKKIDGAKILYRSQDITEYINNYFISSFKN